MGNADSLKVIPESRTSAAEFFFPLSMLLSYVPDLPIDSFTKQYTAPLAVREVGSSQASPDGNIRILGVFLLLSPSDGSDFCL